MKGYEITEIAVRRRGRRTFSIEQRGAFLSPLSG
jgi:hypothetical protein